MRDCHLTQKENKSCFVMAAGTAAGEWERGRAK